MTTNSKYANTVIDSMKLAHEGMEKIKQANQMLQGGPATFYHERVEEYVNGLFSFARFKIGDKVALTEEWESHFAKELDRYQNHGWQSMKHFLVRGAVAIVKSVDFHKGSFMYGVEFENESWISTCGKDKGKQIPTVPTDRHLFSIAERHFKFFSTDEFLRIDVEDVLRNQMDRQRINEADIYDMDIFENGKLVSVPKEVRKEFSFMGLNNVDFITSGFFRKKKV